MNGKKNIAVTLGFVFSVSLIAVSITAFLLTGYYGRIHYQSLGEICQRIVDNYPKSEQEILSALKEYKYGTVRKDNIMEAYGYQWKDFLSSTEKYALFFTFIGFFTGGVLFCSAFFLWRKKEIANLDSVAEYLEKVNTGGDELLFPVGEDAFSRLQDEIYKTVTELYQTRETALKAKNNFAENLSNIAHQLKTPITSLLLSTQMMENELPSEYLGQVRRQLARLTHLEESLLLLSRIEAGTLPLEKQEVDVFTLLMMAADNLQELCEKAGVSVEMPESEEMAVCLDLDWTMEAIMNILKNCLEHTPSGGIVRCQYEQNPLYTYIKIWDTGAGFVKEDIPHLFERFYRGKNAADDGIGIGLSLSRAIIENQNGTISARNLPEGGACFEIHFYSH